MAATLYKTMGVTDSEMCLQILSQTVVAMSGEKKGIKNSTIAINFFKELQPRDAYEAMLISRMISLHSQYMNYLFRATIPDNSTEEENMNINRASKLIRLWNESKASLDKHRKKNDQQIEVKHFYVNANQAIVGSHMHAEGGDR